MTKMAAMLIYGKTLLKNYFQEPLDRFPRILVRSRGESGPFIFLSNEYPGCTLIYSTPRSKFATLAFIWENVTMMDSLVSFASFDLVFGIYIVNYMIN